MCEFHGSNDNGFGDIWWTDNPIYFSSIDYMFSEWQDCLYNGPEYSKTGLTTLS